MPLSFSKKTNPVKSNEDCPNKRRTRRARMKPPVPKSLRSGTFFNVEKAALEKGASSDDREEESKKEQLSETQQEVRQMIKDAVDSGSKNKLEMRSSRVRVDDNDSLYKLMHCNDIDTDDGSNCTLRHLESLSSITIKDDFPDNSTLSTEPGLSLYKSISRPLQFETEKEEITAHMNDIKLQSMKKKERHTGRKNDQLRQVEQKMVEALKGKIGILKYQTKQRQKKMSVAKTELKEKIGILQRCYSEVKSIIYLSGKCNKCVNISDVHYSNHLFVKSVAIKLELGR